MGWEGWNGGKWMGDVRGWVGKEGILEKGKNKDGREEWKEWK